MKKSRQYLKIITTWCFTIFALDSVYIGFSFYGFNGSAASSLTTSQRNSCITIGVLLHYFLLTTFFFSLSITIIQYLIFYHSFKIFKFIYLKAAGFSFGKFELNLTLPKIWDECVIIGFFIHYLKGTPLIIVGIVLAIDYNAYINKQN